MTQIKSGTRITIMTDASTYDAFALEDFDTTDDRSVEIRGILQDDGIGKQKTFNPSKVSVHVADREDALPE